MSLCNHKTIFAAILSDHDESSKIKCIKSFASQVNIIENENYLEDGVSSNRPISLALFECSYKVIKVLLDMGATPNICDLYITISNADTVSFPYSDTLKKIELLLKWGVNPNDCVKTFIGTSTFEIFTLDESENMEIHSNVDISTPMDNAIGNYLCENNKFYIKIAKLLVKYGGIIDCKNIEPKHLNKYTKIKNELMNI